MMAKLIQVFIEGEPFSFTVGVVGVISIEVKKHEKDFVNFTILINETVPTWRNFTHSGNYLIEWME